MAFIVLCLFLRAQDFPVVFNTRAWDWGEISEADGNVSFVFMFRNVSSGPVAIGKVYASCSCIYSEYSRDAVAPGGTGKIVVTFSPAGSAGPTHRSLEVFDSGGSFLGVLNLRADVEPLNLTLQEKYHTVFSDVLLANRHNVPFGYVYHGQHSTKYIYVANPSDRKVTLRTAVADAASLLDIDAPEYLGPGEESVIALSYRIPDDGNFFASLADTVFVFADGRRCRLPITSEAVAMAPVPESGAVMWTYPSAVKLSKTRTGYCGEIRIGNNGTSSLEIKAVEIPEGVTADICAGMGIAPGGRISVNAVSDVPDFTIVIFTNDNIRPYKELRFNK